MKYSMFFGNATYKNRKVQGVAVYDSKGKKIINEAKYMIEKGSNNMINMLTTLNYALRVFSKIKEEIIAEQGNKLIINVQTGLYDWIQRGKVPKAYIEEMDELLVNLSCLPCESEILKYPSKIDIKKYVNFDDAFREEYSSIQDLMSLYEE